MNRYDFFDMEALEIIFFYAKYQILPFVLICIVSLIVPFLFFRFIGKLWNRRWSLDNAISCPVGFSLCLLGAAACCLCVSLYFGASDLLGRLENPLQFEMLAEKEFFGSEQERIAKIQKALLVKTPLELFVKLLADHTFPLPLWPPNKIFSDSLEIEISNASKVLCDTPLYALQQTWAYGLHYAVMSRKEEIMSYRDNAWKTLAWCAATFSVITSYLALADIKANKYD